MFDIKRDPRSEDAYKFYCGKGHHFIKDSDFVLEENEVLIKSLPLIHDEVGTEMVKTALDDLNSFLSESFLLKPDSESSLKLRTNVKECQNGNKRSHTIHVNDDSIEITGSSEWGVASGIYHLQRLLKLRSAPVLKKESISYSPSLDPSLAYPAFKRDITTDFDYPEAYNENYLLRIARAGYTGFHLNLSTSMFSHSSTYIELNNPKASENFETLRKIVSIAKKCSLEVFLSYYTEPLKKEHGLFKKYPSMRGSEIINSGSLYCLCSSSSDTLNYYLEHFENLFNEVKGLAGVLLIVGCEGFLHCYTAPELDREQRTTCSECARKNPEETVTTLMNEITRKVKSVTPEALCIIWTYGIHTWTEDKGVKLVSLLSKDCELMTNFDTGDIFELEGASGNCFDYSLRCIGPGKMYKNHEEIAKEKGLKVLTKCENGTPLEFYNFPSLPANTRWGKKYANILGSDASGALFNWKFMGFIEEIPQELAGWMSWEGYEGYESILKMIAEREFGSENTAKILEAWTCFDEAMEFHPFSGATAGYFKGPFYIAFTHPLILNPSKVDDLCDDFWAPMHAEDFTEKRRRPRFVTDLSWVQPFGVESCLKALTKMEELWAKGCAQIPLNPRTEKHRALAVGMLRMIRTSINMVKFFVVRDEIFKEKLDKEDFREKVEKLKAIAENEYENVLVGRECMDKNPMLGFQYTYRYTFTRNMCESKIKHTKRLIKKTIPRMWYNRLFTMGEKTEWLW